MQNKPSADLIARVLSEILSDKHSMSVSVEAVPVNPESRKDTGESA